MYLPASSNLTKLKKYLNRYSNNQQPAAFELLVGSTFHKMLHLPFQTKDTEDNKVKHRVIWYGKIEKKTKRLSPSSSGPDSICFGHGFYIIVEATLRGKVSNQWRKEFLESLNHYDEFVNNWNLNRDNMFLVLVAPDFHRSTYMGFKQKAVEGYNIIILESSTLAKVSNVSESILTLRHLDIRYLFRKLMKKFRESSSLRRFKSDINKLIADWELDLLKQEKTVYFGLKAYEAMRKLDSKIVGVSDIMLKLEKDGRFERYFNKLGGGDLSAYIREGLIRERLARIVETPGEDFFWKVDSSDFGDRGWRLIRAVESIDK